MAAPPPLPPPSGPPPAVPGGALQVIDVGEESDFDSFGVSPANSPSRTAEALPAVLAQGVSTKSWAAAPQESCGSAGEPAHPRLGSTGSSAVKRSKGDSNASNGSTGSTGSKGDSKDSKRTPSSREGTKAENFGKEDFNKGDFEVRKPGWRALGEEVSEVGDFEVREPWSIQPDEEPHISVHPLNRKTSWCAAGGLGAPHLPPSRVSNDDLQEAALRGDLGLVRRLIASGASVNAPMQPQSMDEFMTLLHLLCSKPEMPNGTRIVNEVIRATADVNARSSSGLTPLILACQHKHIGAVELLMDNKVKTDPVCDAGRNAMCYAVVRDPDISASDRLSCELVTLLFNARADLDDGGQTPPIVEAVKQLNGSVVSLLVEFGAQPLGLSEAIAAAPIKMIQTHTNAEANPFVKDRTGKTPMDLALNRGDHEIMDLLRDFIADLQRRHHRHLETPMQPGYDDIGIYDADDHGGSWTNGETLGARRTGRQSVANMKMSRYQRGKSMFDASSREETALGAMWKTTRVYCRRMTKHRYFQWVMGVMLIFGLYIVDLWQLWDLTASAVLDVLLVIVFANFFFEFMVHVIGFGRAYTFTFYFWMDFFGMISVLLDISFIRDSITIFQNDASGKGGTSDGVVMRAARMAKLGARAGRFTKLVKFLRFLPGIKDLAEGDGTAKVITQSLNKELSCQVSCLIIMVVIFLPMFDILKYPTHDHSLKSWVDHLHQSYLFWPDEMEELVSDFDQFYSGKDYFPFEVVCGFGNNTALSYLFSRPAPDNTANVVEYQSSDQRVTVKFDFGGELRKECGYRIGLVTTIMLILVLASLYMTNSVASIALAPLEDLFGSVRSTATKIFSSLVSVAGKNEAKRMSKTASDTKDSDELDEYDNGAAMNSETLVLEQVINKISKVSALLMKTDSMDAEHMAEMTETDRAVLQGYQVVSVPLQRLNTSEEVPLEDDESDAGLDEILDEFLAGVQLSIDSLMDWDFNPFEMHESQKQAVCLTFLLYHRSAPAVRSAVSNVDLQANYANFIMTCSVEYGSDKDIPYTNWNHAVDVCFTTFNIMKICRMSKYLSAIDRFGLMIASMAHDVGHPGRNNNFLIESSNELAIRYNDQSPLENMHASKLFEMTSQAEHNVFAGTTKKQYRDVRSLCIQAILYTDYQKHFHLVKEIQALYNQREELCDAAEWEYATEDEESLSFPGPDILDFYKTSETQHLLKVSLLHFCDISNAIKPWDLCEMWAEKICEEFFIQGDMERELGLTIQKLHDRNTTSKPYSQIGFIEFFVGPMVIALNSLLPPMDFCVRQLTLNAECWVERWADETTPTPSEDEQAMVLERIVKMASKKRSASALLGQNLANALGATSTIGQMTSRMTDRMTNKVSIFKESLQVCPTKEAGRAAFGLMS